ncbi:hypothetical protein, partial [Oculatella sp. FACHB-28]|uniref:hypothetical protein n=1 Tax=Oculatella sp. FACHB-28 TaxID=2692845 RepID=UPI001A7EC497
MLLSAINLETTLAISASSNDVNHKFLLRFIEGGIRGFLINNLAPSYFCGGQPLNYLCRSDVSRPSSG